MPMVTVQRNLPFSSISPSNRYLQTSSCNTMSDNNSSNSNSNPNGMNSNVNGNSVFLNSHHNNNSSGSPIHNLGLGIPQLQRRQSSNTAQIMDAYALESSLPMLSSFPFFNSNSFVSNNNLNGSASANGAISSAPAVATSNSSLPQISTSSSSQSSPSSMSGSGNNQNSYFQSNFPTENSNGTMNNNTTQSMGLDYPDSRRQNSLDFNTLPPNPPVLQHSTSSFMFNQSLPAFTLSANFDSLFSPPKLPPMRNVSSGDFFPHSSSFDMASNSTLTSGEDFSNGSNGSFSSNIAFSYPPSRQDSLSVPYYNSESASHDDTEVPPLSPLTTYSSPPRSALSTPANAHQTPSQNTSSDPSLSQLSSFMNAMRPNFPTKRSRDNEFIDDAFHRKRNRIDNMNAKDSMSGSYSASSLQSPHSSISLLSEGNFNNSSPHINNKQLRLSHSPHTKSELKKEKKDKHTPMKKGPSGEFDSHLKQEKEKFRHVSPAVKLRGPEESDGSIPTTVEQIYYPRPDQPKPHRIRLIRVMNPADDSVAIYAHGADVGSVVERKSNISRLFGRFESPTEKLLMNVPGPHNHTVGQESNILTEKGMYRFLQTNKMKGQDNYKQWILNELIPRLRDRAPITSTSDAGRKSLNISTKRASPSHSLSRNQSATSPASISRSTKI